VMARDGLVLDYRAPSTEATYYDLLFKPLEREKPELWESVKQGAENPEFVPPRVQRLVERLVQELPSQALVVELGGGLYPNRSGFLSRHFPNYVPVDLSLSSMRQYAEKYSRIAIACDAAALPFRDNSVDCLVSYTFLEHPRRPDEVLREIVRVSKPGTLVIHGDAWFCRWWNRYGIIGLKHFSRMTLLEKAIRLAALFTECPVIRIPPILFRRAFLELGCRPSPTVFPYWKLRPNYDLMLGCDEDASSSIDPFDVIRFYEANGFTLVDPLGKIGRVLLRRPILFMRCAG
jgi:SAM-dependent methyltransferase